MKKIIIAIFYKIEFPNLLLYLSNTIEYRQILPLNLYNFRNIYFVQQYFIKLRKKIYIMKKFVIVIFRKKNFLNFNSI